MKWTGRDSNARSPAYKAGALTARLPVRHRFAYLSNVLFSVSVKYFLHSDRSGFDEMITFATSDAVKHISVFNHL